MNSKLNNNIKINKLISRIYYDLNGTGFGADSTETIAPEGVKNMIIGKNTYGKVVNKKWKLNEDIYNMEGSMSYYEYLRETVKDYKKTVSTYTLPNNPGQILRYIYNNLEGKVNYKLLPSFTNAIKKYCNVQIVLRTFGNDLDSTLEQLEQFNLKPFIKGEFTRTEKDIVLKLSNGAVLSGASQIHNYIADNPERNFALRDYYPYWNNNSRLPQYGKFVLEDGTRQIFFDDNYCVDVRSESGEYLPNSNVFVKVNTLKAIMDPNYYTDLIDNFC